MVMVEDVQDGLLTRMMVEDDCGDEEQTVGGLDLEVERTEETKEGANQAANPYGQGAMVGGGEVRPKEVGGGAEKFMMVEGGGGSINQK